jgi:hypothetical protein
MENPEFKVTTAHNKRTGALLSVYFQIRHGKAEEVREVANGAAFANYDRKGRLLGVELLGPCQVTVLTQLAKKEPAKYKDRITSFLRDSIPRKLALAG